jgi:hypothetical protein
MGSRGARRRRGDVWATIGPRPIRPARLGGRRARSGFERREPELQVVVVRIAVGAVMNPAMARGAQRNDVVIVVRVAIGEAPRVVGVEVGVPASREERCGRVASRTPAVSASAQVYAQVLASLVGATFCLGGVRLFPDRSRCSPARLSSGIVQRESGAGLAARRRPGSRARRRAQRARTRSRAVNRRCDRARRCARSSRRRPSRRRIRARRKPARTGGIPRRFRSDPGERDSHEQTP